MNVKAYRDLQLLTDISSDDSVTQRGLAKRYRLALGLTNFLMRRLIKKGYVKIVNLERKRLRYLITPTGIAEKARLTYEYLDYSLHLYRQIRTLVTRTLSAITRSGGTAAVLYGTGELAEIAFLGMQQRGLTVVAVVDDSDERSQVFMNQSVRPLDVLADLSFDWVLVATFTDRQKIIQRLCQAGVPEEKIMTISETGSAVGLHGQGRGAVLELPEATVGVRS